MKPTPLHFLSLIIASFLPAATHAAPTLEAMRTPVNKVFQFNYNADYSGWADGSKTSARSYLWIPEECAQLKGLIILCANVPEQMLAGHEGLRKVCAKNNLGIVWFPGTFFNNKKTGPNQTTEREKSVVFLQQLLDGLAEISGYPEVATVPWLPMGESGHLLMVDALVETAPERCIAGLWLKNNHLPPKNRTVPAFVLYGSAQEWGQDKADPKKPGDIRTRWSADAEEGYKVPLNERKLNPNWAFTYYVDGKSGHFDCSEEVVTQIIHYVDKVAQARLPLNGSQVLRPVDLNNGYLADLPLPGHENHPVTPYQNASPINQAVPWYFDKESAESAQAMARINWTAETQLPGIADTHGNIFPYTFNGVTWITLNAKPVPYTTGSFTNPITPPVLESEPDGITFQLRGVLLDKIPDNFIGAGAGEKLSKTPGEPTIEWLCGCVEPLGGNRFRIVPDRCWPSPIYIAVRQKGNATVREIVQPAQINRDFNAEGKSQKITFEKIPNVRAGSDTLPLKATSDSGLPVGFFVAAGPAIIQDGNLVFTKIPPHSKYPVTVTVAAWQFGQYAEPKVKRAEIVRQSFQITAE